MSKSRVLISSRRPGVVCRSRSTALALLACLPLGVGCAGDKSDGSDPAPKFSDLYASVVARTCSGPLCHSSAVGGNLVMTSPTAAYAALVDQPAAGPECGDSGLTRVVPGDSAASLLYLKITDAADCGDPMPISSPLDPKEIEEFKQWIDSGAQE